MMHRNHGTSITETEKEFTGAIVKRYCWSTPTQSVFEIDPATVKVEGEHAELAADIPVEPIETSEWNARRRSGVAQFVSERLGITWSCRFRCTSTENPLTDLHY
jgi:hypothetical protein